MSVFSFAAKLRSVSTLAAISIAAIGATPALANSSADISSIVRTAPTSASPARDEQFSNLFSSWRESEKTPAETKSSAALADARSPLFHSARGVGRASIPSRSPLESARLTSGYGMRTHPVLGGRRAHAGIDLASPTGTPVYAPADGQISRADWFSSYGLYIAIEHTESLQTRYAHLSSLNVAAGQRVRKGDVIGFVGSTGRSTGPHLHYEVRVNGVSVDPRPYMQGE